MVTEVEQAFINIEKKFEKQAEEKVSKAVSMLYNEIVDRTPVDTGNLRKNWEIDLGFGYINPGTSFDAKGKIKVSLKQNTEITIRNRTSYAYFIEYGKIGKAGKYSPQAPQGMMRVSAKQFRNYIR